MNHCNPNPCENGANCSVSQVICYLPMNMLTMFICRLLLAIDTEYVGSNCQINVGVQECS